MPAREQNVHRLILGFLLATMAASAIGQFSFAPLGSFIEADLQLSKAQLGSLASAGFLACLIFTFSSGWLVDFLGERKMILLGPLLIGLALSLLFLVKSYAGVLVLLFIVGLGYSVVNPLTNKAVIRWFPENRRSFALGLKQAGTPLGLAAGAAVLPALALSTSWNFAFGLVGIVIVVVSLLVYKFYPEPVSGKIDRGVRHKGTGNAVSFPLGKIIFNPRLFLCGIIGLSFDGLRITLMAFLIPFLQDSFFIPVILAGFYLSTSQVIGVITRPLVGWLDDHFFRGSRKDAMVLCGLTGAVLLFALTFYGPSTPSWLLLLTLILLGGTTNGYVGPWYALALELVDPKFAGLATGYVVTLSFIGPIVGPPVFGWLVDWSASFHLAWRLFALWLALPVIVLYFSDLKKRISVAAAEK